MRFGEVEKYTEKLQIPSSRGGTGTWAIATQVVPFVTTFQNNVNTKYFPVSIW